MTGEQLLMLHPSIYLKMTEVVNIEKVAKAILVNFIPQSLASIALDYMGYPQKSQERINETREMLYLSLLGRDDERYPFSFADPLKSQVVNKLEGIANMITDYVGDNDRVEET